MKINKFIPFAFIYFFLNSVGLPFGLTYMAVFSPLLYWWTIKQRGKEIVFPFLLILMPFVALHLFFGVDKNAYIISFLNFVAIYIFCQAFYTFLKVCKDPENIFRKLLIVNFILCLIAIPFYFTPYYDIFWIQQFFTAGVDNFRRLRLFTYEASYYATLLMPIFAFYLFQIIFKKNVIPVKILLPMLFLPYILSFSLGVISASIFAGLITYLFYLKSLTRKKRLLRILSVAGIAGVSILAFAMIFFPENSLFIRFNNIFSGNDNSGKGRTFEAFYLAGKIIEQKSAIWGIGIGQVKIIGVKIIRDYYNYPPEYAITLPNACAETLAMFGWIGLSIRLLTEIILFFYTRVWTNYYRLLLFFFIFIYQFTGSFITNLAEYVIWILAFTNAFPQFNARPSEKIIKKQYSTE